MKKIKYLNKSFKYFIKINIQGEMAEWFKAQAWKACILLKVSWVRIPLFPSLILPFQSLRVTLKSFLLSFLL